MSILPVYSDYGSFVLRGPTVLRGQSHAWSMSWYDHDHVVLPTRWHPRDVHVRDAPYRYFTYVVLFSVKYNRTCSWYVHEHDAHVTYGVTKVAVEVPTWYLGRMRVLPTWWYEGIFCRLRGAESGSLTYWYRCCMMNWVSHVVDVQCPVWLCCILEAFSQVKLVQAQRYVKNITFFYK